MHRFYCPNLATGAITNRLSDIRVTLDDDESRHARKVLRLREGDTVGLFNGQGTVAAGMIETISPLAVIRVTRAEAIEPATPTIDLAVAMPKGPRADDMLVQLSQVGVDRLIPLVTRHTVVEPRETKIDRLRKMTIESAKQSGRAYLMQIEQATAFEDVLQTGQYNLCLLAHPGDANPVDAATLAGVRRVLILVGPEAGFSDEELQLAQARGAKRWAIGPNVLRIETAAVAAVAIVRYLTQYARPIA